MLVNTQTPSRGLGRARTVHEPNHTSNTIGLGNLILRLTHFCFLCMKYHHPGESSSLYMNSYKLPSDWCRNEHMGGHVMHIHLHPVDSYFLSSLICINRVERHLVRNTCHRLHILPYTQLKCTILKVPQIVL